MTKKIEDILAELRDIDPQLAPLLDRWTQAILEKNRPVRIAACGMLKAGKSTLLNILTDHLDTEYFPSAATRKTRENKEYIMPDRLFSYFDTPGIDADDADDQESLAGVAKSDVVFLVHNLETGELHQQEVEFLEKIITQDAASLANQRLVLVLTHMDNADACEKIKQAIVYQCKKFIRTKPLCFLVSNKFYKNGLLKNEPKFVEKSGIVELKSYLAAQYETLLISSIEARKSNIEKLETQFSNAVSRAIQRRQEKIEELQKPHINGLTKFQKQMSSLRGDLKQQFEHYNQI